ncbi:MAG: MBL fold metallo-hydrolase [Akkermansia muciniphila]|nr:MBL fold metallo-hydrolase [Akkermansia muciniphila]
MRIITLASGSSGNVSLVQSGNTCILVDAGISARRITKHLTELGIAPASLAGVVITHEHLDHISGLGVLSKKHPLRVYCSRYTAQDLKPAAPHARYTYIEPGASVSIGDITVTPFGVSHDALDPLGYLFEHEGRRLGYITDTGCITREILSHARNLHALYLESNYDPTMLRESGRPLSLIERIDNAFGHLSNEQACDFVRTIAHPGLRHLLLGHLSRECNTPEKARSDMAAVLAEFPEPPQLVICSPADRTDWVEV